MSRTVRRFEVLLPLLFNDGNAIPIEYLGQTLLDIEERFGAASCETQIIRGRWRHEGESFSDDLLRKFDEHPLFQGGQRSGRLRIARGVAWFGTEKLAAGQAASL